MVKRPGPDRRVMHVDMDAFYASVEQRDDPSLRGRPVLVGSDRNRGFVAAASYESREFGCRSAMPTAVALRLCPDAVVVRPRMQAYREASDRVFSILESASPLVEPLSIDEAFIEATGTERLLGPAEHVARRLKDAITEATGLTGSVGVAPNKFLAKLASDLEKPDGLVVITPDDVDRVLLPLPVERIWGVGPRTAERLHGVGVRTVADLRAWTLERLESTFGDVGLRFHRLARGLDDRPLVTDGEAKSLGHECTFEFDIEEPDDVREVLLRHAEDVARRLRRHRRRARGVTLKIRYGNFETITRSERIQPSTDLTAPFRDAALRIWHRWVDSSFRPVRLIGVTAYPLENAPAQEVLFPDPEKRRQRRLDEAVDEIRERFGRDSLKRGG
ncbi:MAG: DNA polymerase IV [Planctomycetota bacterium]